MEESINSNKWQKGSAPIAVVMISLNEAHNMEAVLQNLQGFAQEVYLVDSYSIDDTVGIALRRGVHVVQRRFRNFGDQWNFALEHLPIKARWTMKIDPDERLSDELKTNLVRVLQETDAQGLIFDRRLWFMGRLLPVKQSLLRVWRTGSCRFTDIAVNEHPLVDGKTEYLKGLLEHHDSPDLEHWLEKQNHYTTAEAVILFEKTELAVKPRLFGNTLQRRMWLKKHFYKVPFRYSLLFIYHYIFQGAILAGWEGYVWARLRADVMRLVEYKTKEMRIIGQLPVKRVTGIGNADPRVKQCEW